MSCPAPTNKGGKLYISDQPVDCDLTLSELAVLDYAFVPGVGSIGDTGIQQDVVTYPTTDAGLTAQGKGDATARNWDIDVLDAPSQARDILDEASAIDNGDNYATRIEWPNGDVEFSIVQVASRTAIKGAASGVRVLRYTMVPSFVPIVTNALPVATSVAIGGIPFIGATLAATYSYYSPLGLPESGTEYQWYADGVAIPGETSTLLLITGDHTGSLITFGVTPSDGLSYGHEAMSGPVGPVADSARFTADALDLYTDTALTVPVTSYGDAVAGWRGAGLIGVQPTLTARPAYGRMPVSGVVNLLSWSEDISNAAWTGIGCTTPDFETLIPSSGTGLSFASSYVRRTSTIAKSGVAQQWTMSAVVEAAGFNRAGILVAAAGGTTDHARILVSLTDGLVIVEEVAGTFSSISSTTEDIGGGQFEISITFTTGTETALSARMYAGDSVATTGTGTDGIKVTKLQLNQGATEDYQLVTAAYNVTQPGVPDTPILYYDLGDDVLPSAMELPEVTGGTLVIAGEKGIWVDDSFSHAGGSWSMGPTTYTGGPAGLLPALIGNRVLGFTVFANSLTPEQLQVEVAYWMARGAPGVWEGGANLWTDPPTLVDTNWADNSDGTYTNDGVGTGFLSMTAAGWVAGEIGLHEFVLSGHTAGSCGVQIHGGPGITLPSVNTNATYRSIFTPFSSTQGTRFLPNAVFDGTIGAVGFRKLTLNTDPYP